MIFLKSLAISRILCTFAGNYNIKIKHNYGVTDVSF